MGYQESYVTVKDQSKFKLLVELVKQLDNTDFFEDRLVSPTSIITLKKDIEGQEPLDIGYEELLQRMREGKNYQKKFKYSAGTKFIYFSGDRTYQRSTKKLFGKHLIAGTKVHYTEDFPKEVLKVDKKKMKKPVDRWENDYTICEIL